LTTFSTPRVTGHSVYTNIVTTHFNQHYILIFSYTEPVHYGLEIVTSSVDTLHNLHSIDIIECKYISAVRGSPWFWKLPEGGALRTETC